jgi:hypothetical protein
MWTSARGRRLPAALNPSTHGHFGSWDSLAWRRWDLSRSDRDASTWRGKLAATVPSWPTTALLQLLTPRATFGILDTRASISNLDNVSDGTC